MEPEDLLPFYKSQPLVLIRSIQYTSSHYFCKMQINIILPLCLGLPSGHFPSGFRINFVCFSCFLKFALFSILLILLDFITLQIFGESTHYVALQCSLFFTFVLLPLCYVLGTLFKDNF